METCKAGIDSQNEPLRERIKSLEVKIEQIIRRSLNNNDPSLISMMLDIPHEKAREACGVYAQLSTWLHDHPTPKMREEFARFESKLLSSLIAEKNKHD